MKRYSTVDEFIEGFAHWEKAIKKIRAIALSTELDEAIKWGAPAYLYKKKIVLGIGAFKSYIGVWFHQGGLLKDEGKKLMNAQEGKTKALRQWRFGSLEEIDEDLLRAYILESIENFKAGRAIKPVKNKPIVIAPFLEAAFKADKNFKINFDKLSLSKRREYADYIRTAKRATTQQKRLEKIIPMVISGVGLHDKYKNC